MGECSMNKCLRKFHYPDRDAAVRQARSLAARTGDDERMEAYRCQVCGGWVVGRKRWGR